MKSSLIQLLIISITSCSYNFNSREMHDKREINPIDNQSQCINDFTGNYIDIVKPSIISKTKPWQVLSGGILMILGLWMTYNYYCNDEIDSKTINIYTNANIYTEYFKSEFTPKRRLLSDILELCDYTITTVDSDGNVGRYNSLQLYNGLPVISYYDDSNDDLKLVRCLDPTCTIKDITTVDSCYVPMISALD